MNEKLIETVGRLWNELGAQGETSAYDLSRYLGEDEETVHLALGWLIREDKVRSTKKQRETFFSLVDSELQTFQGFYGDGSKKKRRSFWRKNFLR